jgi:excisionase family DNA binding protein
MRWSMNDYYTVTQVAEKLMFKTRTIREMIARGTLGAIKYGNKYRVSGADVKAFLAEHKVKVRQNQPHMSPDDVLKARIGNKEI